MTDRERDALLLDIQRKLTDLTGQMNQVSNQVVYSCAQAAEYLRCSNQWIRSAANSGRIPFTKVGKDFRFKKSDLDAFKTSTIGARTAAKLEEMYKARQRRCSISQ